MILIKKNKISISNRNGPTLLADSLIAVEVAYVSSIHYCLLRTERIKIEPQYTYN